MRRKEARHDPGMTFDTFVVGPANRLAAAAARRAAEEPGRSFNPLFLYAAPGLGKSHILTAIAHQACRAHPDHRVTYRTLEQYLDHLAQTLETSRPEDLHEAYEEVGTLLLDDVQFLVGHPQAQQLLLRTLDRLTGSGAQVVLASDRPPSEIDGLDERLLSRFSQGLIVDMGAPDYETRVAILRRKAEARGSPPLGEGVAEAMARYPFRNVRELQGALNQVLAVQDLEGRTVAAGDIPSFLGELELGEGGSGASVSGHSSDPGPRWRHALRGEVRAAESEGFQVRRLAELLAARNEPPDWQEVLEAFRTRVRRLRAITEELNTLGYSWREDTRAVLRDPERTEDAERLLLSARERVRTFARVPEGPALRELHEGTSPLAVRAVERLLSNARPEYNPLFLHAKRSGAALSFLEAVARYQQTAEPTARMALTSVEAFSSDFVRALSEGVAPAWRERWWSVDLLLVQGIERLGGTERAQDEFFHLFEALTRRGVAVILASDRPPERVEGVDPRLRSRFQGGLVLELDAPTAALAAGPIGAGAPAPASAKTPPSSSPHAGEGRWFPPREKVIWEWPRVEERIVTWEA